MKFLGYQFLGLLLFVNSLCIFAQDAPVSTIGFFESTGLTASVPITVTGFENIGSCNLQLVYDPAILTCTSVEKSSLLTGGLATNLEVPGIITLGWYTWPGVTLPDYSEVFILKFSKVSAGSSIISWSSEYTDRQWSDGNSFALNDQPVEGFYYSGALTFEEDAPITTVPDLISCAGSTLDVPFTIVNFNTIGALSLTLHFNAEVLTYLTFTNNSEFPGLSVFSPEPGTITAAGFASSSGITLPDDAILFTLHFTTLEGVSEIFWVDDGISCEYTGPPPTYNVLNDIPQESFYINGNIMVNAPPVILMEPVSPDTISAGSGVAVFTVEAEGNLLVYHWQEYVDSWSDLDEGGIYSGVFSAELSIVDPPISMNGNKYRCLVSNNCEPPAVTDGLATLLITEFSGFMTNESDEDLYFTIYPNPCNNETCINYQLHEAGIICIDILDLSGAVKLSFYWQKTTPGDYHSVLNTKQLLPGIYMARIRLNANNNPNSGMVKIVKLE